MRIAVMVTESNGRYPVPAVKGGAITVLVEHFAKNNEAHKLADLSIVSYYDDEAYKLSKEYGNTEFIWIKVPKLCIALDNLLFNFVTTAFPNKKSVSFRSLISLFWYTWKAHGILKRRNFDRVVIESNMISFNMLRGAKKKYDGKYYLHLHNIPRTDGFAKGIIQSCKAALCISDYVGNKIAEPENSIGPIEREKIHTYYNCVDTSKFRKVHDGGIIFAYRQKYGISSDDYVVAFTGRLAREKGVDKLLEATRILNDETITVLIAGSYYYSSDYRDSYREQLEELAQNQASRVIFTGFVPNNELAYIYNIGDVAVLPSVWDEPAGLTMVEAMACGTLVITTDAGGIPEYMGDCAFIVKNDENLSQSLASEILKVKSLSVQNRERLVERGIQRIRDNFSSDGYLERLLAFM